MTKQKLIKVTFKVEVSQKNIHRMHFMAVECGNMFLESAQVSLDMQCQMIWSGESSAADLTLEWFHSRVFSLKQGINTVCFYFVVTEVSANNFLVFLSLEIWDLFSWMLDICQSKIPNFKSLAQKTSKLLALTSMTPIRRRTVFFFSKTKIFHLVSGELIWSCKPPATTWPAAHIWLFPCMSSNMCLQRWRILLVCILQRFCLQTRM